MKVLATLIVCSFVLLASSTSANELPPVPEGGLYHYEEYACFDRETDEVGDCVMSMDMQGNRYLTFIQNEEIMFLRRVYPDSYETFWVNDKYNTF
jgi:hypothetical protein